MPERRFMFSDGFVWIGFAIGLRHMIHMINIVKQILSRYSFILYGNRWANRRAFHRRNIYMNLLYIPTCVHWTSKEGNKNTIWQFHLPFIHTIYTAFAVYKILMRKSREPQRTKRTWKMYVIELHLPPCKQFSVCQARRLLALESSVNDTVLLSVSLPQTS